MIFDCGNLLYYKCHKINFKLGGSYIDSLDCIKKKKATINPKSDNNKCFQYAETITLNHEKIESNLYRVLNIETFINNYN